MKINNETFFHVSENLNWAVGQQFFVGDHMNSRCFGLMNRGFITPNDRNEPVPTSALIEAVAQYVDTSQKAPFAPSNYHYNPTAAIKEVIPIMRTQLNLIRELIFEEVRRTHFPNKMSRYNAVQVIASDKEALGFWLPQLKSPGAKIYKLSLQGEIHRGNLELLDTVSYPAEFYRSNAFRYWAEMSDKMTPQDEMIFRGIVSVQEIIDADKF